MQKFSKSFILIRVANPIKLFSLLMNKKARVFLTGNIFRLVYCLRVRLELTQVKSLIRGLASSLTNL
jgi:hypothetical protein